jgi:hypothetical protein
LFHQAILDVGADHLLLGVLRLPAHESAGIGPRVLADLGVTLDRARAEVQRRVSGPEPGLTAVLDQLGRAA